MHADEHDISTRDSTNNKSAAESSNNVSASSCATHDSATDGSLESSSDIINDMYSSLPNCNFTSEGDKKMYVQKLLKIKYVWSGKVQQLQKDV